MIARYPNAQAPGASRWPLAAPHRYFSGGAGAPGACTASEAGERPRAHDHHDYAAGQPAAATEPALLATGNGGLNVRASAYYHNLPLALQWQCVLAGGIPLPWVASSAGRLAAGVARGKQPAH